jgi:peptide/nickel transport system permease protein
MIRLIINRIFATILVLIGVSFVVFAALHFSPGDVARTILGLGATEERVQALRQELGLDRPLLIQYWDWMMALLRGDLGRSISLGVPVSEVIFDKIWASLLLMGASFFLTVSFGLLFAALSGGYHRSLMDRLITLLMLLLASLPPFWLGIVLLIIFGLKLRIFPISGVGAMADDATLYVVAMHLILPAVTTAASSLAVVARVTRSAFIDEMGEPYVQSARARGLSQRRIISIETMRNVLPSFVTIAGLQIGFLFSSALFSEIVFNWPGIGLQLYLGIVQRDFPVVQGCVLAIAIVFVVGNLLADILSIALDPRRRG